MKERKKGSIRARIKNQYRLIIRREETLEERYALVLTPMNVLILFSGIFVLFFILSAALFFYSPLKEYVPGYKSTYDPSGQVEFLQRIDSLERTLTAMRLKSGTVERILMGMPEGQDEISDTSAGGNASEVENPFSDKEKELREEIEQQKEYATSGLSVVRGSAAGQKLFFKPLDGLITDTFSAANRHYAIDIVGSKNKSVKATLDGMVVFSGWTPETGHMLVVQHANNWISVYKHNSSNFKKEGTFVNAGEAIALVGNSGEMSTGPHLHFELWHNGKPVNPVKYLYD